MLQSGQPWANVEPVLAKLSQSVSEECRQRFHVPEGRAQLRDGGSSTQGVGENAKVVVRGLYVIAQVTLVDPGDHAQGRREAEEEGDLQGPL